MNTLKKITAATTAGLLALSLAACSGGNSSSTGSASTGTTASAAQEKPADLTGTWKSEETEGGGWTEAVIEGKTITVYIVGRDSKSKSLYWAGSYVAPTKAGDYSWDSKNDHEKTKGSLLGSTDETKKFTYKNGVLSYEMSMAGTTTTFELKK